MLFPSLLPPSLLPPLSLSPLPEEQYKNQQVAGSKRDGVQDVAHRALTQSRDMSIRQPGTNPMSATSWGASVQGHCSSEGHQPQYTLQIHQQRDLTTLRTSTIFMQTKNDLKNEIFKK